jgi:hypothetical protein
MPDAAAAIAVCLPLAAPLRELTWDVDRERGRFGGVRARDPAAAAAAVRALTAEALSAEAAIVVFPELAVDPPRWPSSPASRPRPRTGRWWSPAASTASSTAQPRNRATR